MRLFTMWRETSPRMKPVTHMRGHSSARWRDANVALGGTRDLRAGGFSLVEALVTVTLVAILFAIAMPHALPNAFNLWQAQVQLIGDLRLARTDALTKGNHFQLAVTTSSSYAIYRMTFNGATWAKSGVVLSGTLPANVTFTRGGGATFEFNTRGMLILPGEAATLTLADGVTGHTRNVTVWPSGQVIPL
jgi:type II secretory pathway pseudopilin PulG